VFLLYKQIMGENDSNLALYQYPLTYNIHLTMIIFEAGINMTCIWYEAGSVE